MVFDLAKFMVGWKMLMLKQVSSNITWQGCNRSVNRVWWEQGEWTTQLIMELGKFNIKTIAGSLRTTGGCRVTGKTMEERRNIPSYSGRLVPRQEPGRLTLKIRKRHNGYNLARNVLETYLSLLLYMLYLINFHHSYFKWDIIISSLLTGKSNSERLSKLLKVTKILFNVCLVLCDQWEHSLQLCSF